VTLLPPSSWLDFLENECKKAYYLHLESRLVEAYSIQPEGVFPPSLEIFTALEYCNPSKVKIVILGQDPYPTAGFAHGLAFSVHNAISTVPKSLNNIFLELCNDLQVNYPSNGDLSRWSHQGVLLLNSILTVEAGKSGAHAGWGWEIFTDFIIQRLNNQHQHLVFMLWGTYAQHKAKYIDSSKHLILKAPHPSPRSAYRGFFGCRHFSQANAFLKSNGVQPIAW